MRPLRWSQGNSALIASTLLPLLLLAACAQPTATATSITTTSTTSEIAPDGENVAPETTGVEPSPPEPVQGEDVGDYLVRCYAEFGFIANNLADETFVPEGGIALSFPGGAPGDDARSAAGEKCTTAAVEAGLLVDYDDPEQVRRLYREVAVPLYECLTANGYAVPPPPSEDVFVEEKGGNWDPYSEMPVFTGLEASKICPAAGYGGLDLRNVDLGQGD